MKEELKQLGLTDNEATVYLALLGLGSINAGKIIKKTKLHRNIVYDNLDKLIEKGLVSFVKIRNIKHFETTDSREIKEYIERQRRELIDREKIVNKILPEIRKRRRKNKGESDATIYKGKKGLKTIMDEMAGSKTEILILGSGWRMKENMETYYEQWHLKAKKNKVKVRILLPINKRGRVLSPLKVKYLPSNNVIVSTICIYENKVLNIIWEDELGILIISDKASQSYKEYFETLWKISRQ
jgi:sugar-specific transcriptional regulator TrmB|tara:strand:- start:910 stop:1632 length:723 start_codon:yes stop_codon:yes gene_type:complete